MLRFIASVGCLLLLQMTAEALKIGDTCPQANERGNCPTNSKCTTTDSSMTCSCSHNYAPTTDKSACKKIAGQKCTKDAECITGHCSTTCITKINAACSGNGQSSTCPGHAECTASKCQCSSRFSPNTAMTDCDKNGAAALTATLVLMTAAFVASRFF